MGQEEPLKGNATIPVTAENGLPLLWTEMFRRCTLLTDPAVEEWRGLRYVRRAW